MRFILFLPESGLPQNAGVLQVFADNTNIEWRALSKLSKGLGKGEVGILSTIYEDQTPANFTFAEFLKRADPFVLVDYPWFNQGTLRQTHARVVFNGFHPCFPGKFTVKRQVFHQLGLSPVQPWKDPVPPHLTKVLVAMPTARFLQHYGETEESFKNKVEVNLPKELAQVTFRYRGAQNIPAEEAIVQHDVVVTYGSEMGFKALHLGVPAIDLMPDSVLRAFTGATLAHIGSSKLYCRTLAERERFFAFLATWHQAPVEKLAEEGFLEKLITRQKALLQRAA